MENRPAIEAWRATLASNERQKTNHPNSIYRKWQASRSIPMGEDKAARLGGRPAEDRERAIAGGGRPDARQRW
jgi:hypothetical protein